ncbi:MAG: NAD-dependent epimerase/dehydratase family protein, partial [Candidatus Binatia bacterium]
MSKDTFLVIGASGLVGRCLMGTLQTRGAAVVGTYASRPSAHLRRLDIVDASQVDACLAELQP